MLRTLVHIPNEVAGWPVLGFGILLAAWIIFSVALVAVLVRRRGFDAEVRGYLPILGLIALAIAVLLPRMTDATGLPIRGYGAMLVVAVCSACALAARRARQMGVDPEIIFSLAFWLFLGGIVGARVFYIVEYWEQFRGATVGETLWELANVAQGGLVIYGALFGAALALLGFVRHYRVPLLPLCDLIAAPAVLGLAVGRIGCLLNGCCFGTVTDLPWAVSFPADSPPYMHQLDRGEIAHLYGLNFEGNFADPPVIEAVEPHSPADHAGLRPGERITSIDGRRVDRAGQAYALLVAKTQPLSTFDLVTDGGRARQLTIDTAPHSLPVHPTQIYSTFNGLVICLFLWVYYPFRRRDGEVLALLLTIYPVTRFLLEMIRTDEPTIFGTGLTVSQNISLLILVGTAVLWIFLLKRPAGSVLPADAAAG